MSFEVKEILALPDKEKKRIADLIYESLASSDENSNIINEPLPEWQKNILDERITDLKEHPENFLSWEETKKELDSFYPELRNKRKNN